MKQLFILLGFVLLAAQCKDPEVNTITDPACQKKCEMAGDPGPCEAAFPRYYFDPIEKKCKPFTWGGCGTFPFETLQECEACGCE